MLKRVVKLSISFVVLAIDQAKHLLLVAIGKKCPGTCMVLYYHVVTDERRETFASQMDTVQQLARPISLEGPIALEPRKHHVAITFDDAFRGSLRNALPELEKRNIPITVFVPTGCLGVPAPWLTSDEYEAHGGVVISVEELRDLAKNRLVSLGSHCVNHCPLPSLPDEEAREEIFRSKSDLEAILDKQVEMLSFPHGTFEQKHVAMAREAGYSHAFSIEPALAFTNHDGFLVGRVRVDPTDWLPEFRLKVLGAYRWVVFLKQILGSRNRHE